MKQISETSNLILRNWQAADAAALYEMSMDDAVIGSGLYTFASPESCREAVDAMVNDDCRRVIVDRRSNCFAGYIELGDMNRYPGYMELEYAIIKSFRGRGYAAEAVRRMVDYGFGELGLIVIAAWVRSHNLASCRVMEKCGFGFEGRLRKHARDGSDTLCYSILREEWEKKTL